MTADAGAAPAATDASPDSSTGTMSEPTSTPVGTEQRMLDTIRRVREGAKGAQPEAADDEGQQPAPAAEKEQAEPHRDGDETAEESEEQNDKAIPLRAFKERLAREKEKREALSARLGEAEDKAGRLESALHLLAEEYQRISGLLEQGAGYDPRDSELAQHRLAERARQEAERLTSERAKAREESERQARLEDTQRALRREMDDALASHDLVDWDALYMAMRRDPSRSAVEVAAELQERLIVKARGKLLPEKPQAPAARKPGTAAPLNYTNDVDGIEARIRALKQRAG